MAKKTQKPKQKLSAKQIEERARAAEERARKAEEAAAKKVRMKQIFTVVVCIILVLALGIPTISLSLLGAGL